mgnify:CR=1 FL=1
MHFISYGRISYVCMQSGLTRKSFGIKMEIQATGGILWIFKNIATHKKSRKIWTQ